VVEKHSDDNVFEGRRSRLWLGSNYDFLLSRYFFNEGERRYTWEQHQEIMRMLGYPHKECQYCGRVFYYRKVVYDSIRYCSLEHVREAYNKRRREKREKARSNKICLSCENKFESTRAHAKYCCESHRVLACLARKEKAEKSAFEAREAKYTTDASNIGVC